MTWQRARTLFATWGWAILATLGVLLGGLGLGLGLSLGFNNPWTTVSLSFAQAILSAGMVTGVIRAAQQAGFFKDQLREVIYDDSLNGSLIDANAAWRSLTRGLFRQRFSSLTDSNLDSLSVGSLIGDAEYFYENHWRQLDIEWLDEAKGILLINEVVSATIRTADLGRPVRFINRYQSESDDSNRNSIKFHLSGSNNFSIILSDADVVNKPEGRQELEALLPPADTIKLRRTTVKSQQLQSDPILNFRSNCLWAHPEIVVTTPKNSNLKFYFRTMGMPNPFSAKDGTDIDGPLTTLNAQCGTLCLPGQGYMIVIVRV